MTLIVPFGWTYSALDMHPQTTLAGRFADTKVDDILKDVQTNLVLDRYVQTVAAFDEGALIVE